MGIKEFLHSVAITIMPFVENAGDKLQEVVEKTDIAQERASNKSTSNLLSTYNQGSILEKAINQNELLERLEDMSIEELKELYKNTRNQHSKAAIRFEVNRRRE